MIKDKKTAIVGSVVGLVILLTIFCCEGKKEAVEAAPAVEATPAVEELKETVEEVVTPVEESIEEVKESIEEILPAESVE